MGNKLYLLILCMFILIPLNGLGQFDERFSDNELSGNPSWSGNLDLFRISNHTLGSNFSSKGSGYISTQLAFSDSACWHFDCGLNFNTTSSTFANIYLISDTENPSNCNNGYFLSLKSGIVSLCKIKDKKITTLFTIPDISTARPSIYQYKIERKKSTWNIEVWNGAALSQKLLYTESQPTAPSGYFALLCWLNTNAALAGFSSQFIEVSSLKGSEGSVEEPDPNPDPEEPIEPEMPEGEDDMTTPIIIKTAVPIDSAKLRLTLNRRADLSKLRVELLGHDPSPSFTTTNAGNEILIQATLPFIPGTDYTILIAGIIDPVSGWAVQCSKTFTYYPPISEDSPLRISELMLNPNGVKGIPAVEYVEIYNASKQPVNLSGYGLLYGDKRYIMPAYILPTDRYAVLTHQKNSELFDPSLIVVPLLSFPALNNTSQSIGLSNSVRQTMQLFTYSSNWYNSSIYRQGGYSLECIDLRNPLNDITNWSASVAPEGGTPGQRNSIERANTDITEAHITEISFPHNNQLQVRFSKEMNIAELQNCEYYKFSTHGLWVESSFANITEPSQVALYLNRPLDPNERTLLSISGIKCRSGYPMISLIEYPIALPQSPIIGSVLINEILTNPKEGGYDYIELYNRSIQMVDISDLLLSSRNTLGEMQSRKIITSDRVGLPPNHYLLLSTDTSWVAKEYGNKGAISFRKMNGMPALNNKSGNIILLNRSIEILDELSYNETFHTSAMKNKKGIALERLSAELPSQDQNNWGSASSSFRYGTPGYENSKRYNFQCSEKPFTLSPKVIVPNSGNRNDRLNIQYDLPADEQWVDIQICTMSAFVIKTICLRTLLSGKGMLTWDGKTDKGNRVNKGVYIVYIKTLNKKHIAKVYRFDIVVG